MVFRDHPLLCADVRSANRPRARSRLALLRAAVRCALGPADRARVSPPPCVCAQLAIFNRNDSRPLHARAVCVPPDLRGAP